MRTRVFQLQSNHHRPHYKQYWACMCCISNVLNMEDYVDLKQTIKSFCCRRRPPEEEEVAGRSEVELSGSNSADFICVPEWFLNDLQTGKQACSPAWCWSVPLWQEVRDRGPQTDLNRDLLVCWCPNASQKMISNDALYSLTFSLTPQSEDVKLDEKTSSFVSQIDVEYVCICICVCVLVIFLKLLQRAATRTQYTCIKGKKYLCSTHTVKLCPSCDTCNTACKESFQCVWFEATNIIIDENVGVFIPPCINYIYLQKLPFIIISNFQQW